MSFNVNLRVHLCEIHTAVVCCSLYIIQNYLYLLNNCFSLVDVGYYMELYKYTGFNINNKNLVVSGQGTT